MSHSRKLPPGQRSCGVVDEIVRQLSMATHRELKEAIGSSPRFTPVARTFVLFGVSIKPEATPPDNRTNLAVWYPHGV